MSTEDHFNLAGCFFRAVENVNWTDPPFIYHRPEPEEAISLCGLNRNGGPILFISTIEQLRRSSHTLLDEAQGDSFKFCPDAWKRQKRALLKIISRFLGESSTSKLPAMFWTHRFSSSMTREVKKAHSAAQFDFTMPRLSPVTPIQTIKIGFQADDPNSLEITPDELLWCFPEGTDWLTGYVHAKFRNYVHQHRTIMTRHREQVGVSGFSREFLDCLRQYRFPVHANRSQTEAQGFTQLSQFQVLGVAMLHPVYADSCEILEAAHKQLLFMFIPGTGELAYIATNNNLFNAAHRTHYGQYHYEDHPFWPPLKRLLEKGQRLP